MRRNLLIIGLLAALALPRLSSAEPTDDEGLIPIYKVLRCDPKRWETIYVIGEDRAKELDEHENFQNKGLLGYASKEKGRGLVPLYEAYRDGWHVYYTEKPRGPLPGGTQVKVFCYVWERKQRGTVPVFGCSGTDWRNLRLYLDRDDAKEQIKTALDAKSVRLLDHGVFCYMVPPEESDDSNED